LAERNWYVYEMQNMSLEGWRSFGVKHEQVRDNRDMSAMARALAILTEVKPSIDWYDGYHEFWLLECPCAPPFVCVRPGQNPFDAGYVVSPILLPHLKAATMTETSVRKGSLGEAYDDTDAKFILEGTREFRPAGVSIYVPRGAVENLAEQIAISLMRQAMNAQGLKILAPLDFERLPEIAREAMRRATGATEIVERVI
jgi:hypothetical protein